MSYSVDLSSRVINWVLSGKSRKSASEVFEVHYNTVKQWVKRFKETGEYPSPVTKRLSSSRRFDREELRQAVLESPETFQNEHASRFGVSQSAISQTLAKMGLTRKQKTTHYQEQEEAQKQAFLNQLQGVTDETSLVYLDECGIPQNLYREYGWAPRGEEVFGKRTGKREKKLNLIAAYTGHQLQSPFLYEGVMNTALFNTYLTEYLLPVLTPGQILVMDNASFQKSAETRRLVESKGCRLWFLPPYSPELNPIEHLWAVLKRYVRRFQSQFASLTRTLDFIFQTVPLFKGD